MAHSRDILEPVFHGITDPIAVIRPEGEGTFRFSMGNRACFEAGFFAESHLGKTISDIFPPDLASELERSYREAAREGKPVVFDKVVETRFGKIIGEISYYPIVEDGSCTALIVIAKDITERKRREAEIERQNLFYRTLLNGIEDAVFVANADAGIMQVNRAFEDLFGWTGAELIGLPFGAYPFVHARMREESAGILRRLQAGGRISNFVTRRLRKDGSEVDVSVSYSIIRDPNGNADAIAGVYRDISEQKRRERLLEESEQRYKSLFEHNPDAVFSFDRDGNITSFNARTSAISGYPPERLSGRSILSFCHPEDVAGTSSLVGRALDGESVTYEVRILHHLTNDYFTMKVTNLPIVVNEEIVGVYAIAKDVTPLKSAQRELSESSQLYKSLFDHNPDGVYTLDPEGRFMSFNQAVPGILGFPAEELSGMSYIPFIHPEDLAATLENFTAALQGEAREYELRAKRNAEDQYRTLTIKNLPIYINGEIKGVFGIAKDITEWKKTRQDLIRSEERHRQLIELSPDPIVVLRQSGLLFWNRAAAECFRADDDRSFSRYSMNDLIVPEDADRAAALGDRIRTSGEIREPEEIRLRRLDGTAFHAEIVGTRLEYDAQPATLLIVRDIGKRKKSERLVEYMAYHDALTGLPNRLRFYRMVEERLSAPSGAMFFIDLDRFKLINDALGHRTGDHLLNEVSRRLKRIEDGVVSRQGGDEFTAFFPNADRAAAERTAASLLALLAEPYLIDGHELYVTPSIGISLFPGDSDDVETLIQQADAALYEAKNNGGNTFAFFSTETEKMNLHKLSLGNDLRKAPANDELFLCYQPKYDINDRRIVGAEALIRWRHPGKGLIPPDQFIPFAEETGLIIPIGEWVLRTACLQTKAWHDAGYRIAISVNLSVRQFMQHSFIEQIDAVLRETGLEPHYLNLEITESVPLLDLQAAVGKLEQIKKLGVAISLDDFGTGYSSLNYIRQLPFDFLKIDKSFIQNMHRDEFNTSIVRSVISIAHLMGKKVVAEGVETGEHLRLLQQSECDEAQGYYLSRPVDSSAFERLLAESRLATQ